ncbi:MAG: hypothetical protein ACXWJM_11530 [Ramlibacter sp.]
MDYLGEHLTGRIEMDGNRFEKCIFRDAVMIYAGGPPPTLLSNNFERASFTFEGAAASTILFLTSMRTSGFETIVDSTLENIRTGRHPRLPPATPSTVEVQSGPTETVQEKLRKAEAIVRAMDVGPPDLPKLRNAIDVILLCRDQEPRTRYEFDEREIRLSGGINERISIKDGLYFHYASQFGEEAMVRFYENMEILAWRAAGCRARPSIVDAIVERLKAEGAPHPETSFPLLEFGKQEDPDYFWDGNICRRRQR